ncbi:MAG: leucine-rich repeat domain-containing protein [Bacteroidetes bacterium]|nr:leucine-rich repeat domain-containing protein [Bacteroidota bacterium]
MKQQLLRILFLIVILFAAEKTQAQYVTIPDTNFVTWLNANGYSSCMNGNMMDTTCSAVVNATSVDCSNKNISDLTGIEYFDSLKYLYCNNNQLSSLPTLPNSLTKLYCGKNQLSSLPVLPNSMTYLDCWNNQLTSLPTLPNSLTHLFCLFNQLTSLPALPNLLTDLGCTKNQLTSLPALPISLTHLNSDENQLTNLPSLPNSLTILTCNVNQLTSLPALPNSLTKLNCYKNQLASVPALPNSMANLDCGYNQLTGLPALPSSMTVLTCGYNQLTNLPALPNSLTEINCGDNQLTSLPTLPNSLAYLRCGVNQLTSLPALPNSMTFLDCSYNQLTILPALPNSMTWLFCHYNQLTSLPALPDSLFYCHCYNNPNLYCLPKLKTITDLRFYNTGIQCLPNYGNVTTSNPPLSTIPLCIPLNGNGCDVHWKMQGHVYADTNSNCIYTNGEKSIDNIKILLTDTNGMLLQQTYTGGEGLYTFDSDTGYFKIKLDTTNFQYLLSCPISNEYALYMASIDSFYLHNDFGITCKPGFDVGVSTIVRDSGIFRPANFTNVKILAGDLSNHYGLHCAAGISGAVQIIITGPATYISTVNGALTPIVNGDTLTYTIPDFGLVDFYNDFQIQVQTDTLAQLGDQVCFDVNVTPTIGDNNPANNTLAHCFTVVNSYDPNLKSVSPVNNLSINDKKLTYTIQFQNTGNAAAQHIYVMDTLDAALDVSTFELLAYSHQPQVQLIGNNLRFNFPNINLPDSTNDEPNSHGYVQFSIKLKDSLSIGTIIKNTSYIYFDFNPPVQTNTTINTIIGTGFNFTETQNNISVYPNPTNNSITIATNIVSNNGVIKLYDMLGKELKTQKINSHNAQMNLQEFSVGNYILKIFDGGSLVGVKRVVKM